MGKSREGVLGSKVTVGGRLSLASQIHDPAALPPCAFLPQTVTIYLWAIGTPVCLLHLLCKGRDRVSLGPLSMPNRDECSWVFAE